MIYNRLAFTMIELIFIILIIGILASIALPKLSAVRDDAKLATDISRMATCAREAGAQYTSAGTHLAAGDSLSCDNVVCYNISIWGSDTSDFTVVTVPNATVYCSTVDTVGGHLAKTYKFRGSKVSF